MVGYRKIGNIQIDHIIYLRMDEATEEEPNKALRRLKKYFSTHSSPINEVILSNLNFAGLLTLDINGSKCGIRISDGDIKHIVNSLLESGSYPSCLYLKNHRITGISSPHLHAIRFNIKNVFNF